MESIPGVSADGEEIEIQIKGEKTRDILTQTTGMGRGTVNQFEKVERLGSEAAIEALLDGKISVGTAEELADNLTQDEQTELLQQAGKEELGEKEIRKAVKRKKEELNPNILNAAVVKADLRDVVKTVGKKEILLNDEARMRYYKCIKELEDFLKEMCDQEYRNMRKDHTTFCITKELKDVMDYLISREDIPSTLFLKRALKMFLDGTGK